MKNLLIAIIILSTAFSSSIFAQKKNTDKIELELQKYFIRHGQRGGTTSDIMPYIIINGKYIEDKDYDKKFFRSIFSDCPTAYKRSKLYLDKYRKSKKIKRIGFWTGLSVGTAGIAYFLSKKNKNSLYYSGLSAIAGMSITYLFRYKAKKIRQSGYKHLKSGVDYYDKNCYVESTDFDTKNTSDSTEPTKPKKIKRNKFKRKYEIKMDNFRRTSFLRLAINYVGLKFGYSTLQVFPGIELSYFKNGLSINSEINSAIFDGESLIWLTDYSDSHSAYPTKVNRPLHMQVGISYPLISTTKPYRPTTLLGKNRTINYTLETGGGKKLVTYGILLRVDYDKSTKRILAFRDASTSFAPSTNSLGIKVVNPIFFQSSSNLAIGLNRNVFSSYTLETNDNRFKSHIKSTTLVSSYAVAKFSLNHKFSDMEYNAVVKKYPIVFNDLDFTKFGFATGVSLETKSKFYGYKFSFELGLNPHIDKKNYKDYYGQFKAGILFGKVFN